MSWDDFERYRSGQTPRQPKRRRLFPGTAVPKDKLKQADFVASFSTDLPKNKSKQADVIASFDSDSDSESCPKQKQQSKNSRSVKRRSSTRENSVKQKARLTALQTLSLASSPGNIDSFESDSSAQEFTPPPVERAKENKAPVKHDATTSEKVAVKTVKLGFEPNFDSSFSAFETNFDSSFLESETKCNSSFSELPIEMKPLETEVKTPTKRSAATWLKGIKSPEFKPALATEDKSAKKLLSKKHAVGSLAQRAQSMMRFNKGEYLMWLHKNIHSAPKPPFNSSCYFGTVVSTEMKTWFNLIAVETQESKVGGRNVTVLIPGDKKYGEFCHGRILVVFPEFYCFIKNSENILVALFHAQFFEKDYFDFVSIPKFDHFTGITESAESVVQISSQLNYLDNELPVSVPRDISPCYPIDLHVCVYHIRPCDTHVQLLCCDAKNNLILIEIPANLAQQNWDQIGLSLGTTCYFTSLHLRHIIQAYKCFAWFPQLKMFSVGCQRKVHCFEMVSGSVTLQGDVSYVEDQIISENRSDFIGKYLGFIPDISGRTVCYFVSLHGTTQWIECNNSNPPNFKRGECFKFSNLISCGPLSYKLDILTLVSHCFLNKTLNITYPDLYSYADEEEFKISDVKIPSLSPFNQFLPELSPCLIKLVISDVGYVNKEFNITGRACGVVVNLKVSPGTVRRLLGTGNIVSSDLVRLKGREFSVNGVVVAKCQVVEHALDFMK